MTMNILVCVKQVLDPEAAVAIDRDARWVASGPETAYRMNRYDEFAVEAAVQLQENDTRITVDVITVGPERSDAVLRRAMGMGADHGIHVTTDFEGPLDPRVTAAAVASVARDRSCGLILAGVMSEDAMQGLVGPMAAECLGWPCATSVMEMDVAGDRSAVAVEREMEGGRRDVLSIRLPAVITVQSGINTPRYPSLSNMLRANRQPLDILSADGLGLPTPLQAVTQVRRPEKSRAGLILGGSPEEKAQQLLGMFLERSFLG